MRRLTMVAAVCVVCIVGALAFGQSQDDDAAAQRFAEAKRRLAERQRAAAEAKAHAASQPAIVMLHPTTLPAASQPTTRPVPATLPTAATTKPAASGSDSASAATELKPARPEKDIIADIDRETKAIFAGYPLAVLSDPKNRAQFMRDAAPGLRRHLGFLDELTRVSPARAESLRVSRCRDLALLSLYGEPAAARDIAALSASSKPSEAALGRTAAILRDWWSEPNSKQQQKLLAPIAELARSHPTDDLLLVVYLDMAKIGAGSDDVATAIRDVVESTLTGAAALKYKARPDKLGRPLVVTGTTFQGKAFSTEPWKGKVVVLDFWATWCPPCRAALPQVSALYQAKRAYGLEIVGISCDSRRPDLQQFLVQHPEILWPQLYAPTGKDGMHALAVKFQVTAIPTMYVIDRNGILRDISVGSIPEPLIVELLNEPAKPQASPAAGKATTRSAAAVTAAPVATHAAVKAGTGPSQR